MYRLLKILVVCLLALTSSCSSASSKKYRIAIDMSWYPMEVMDKKQDISGFSRDLLEQMAHLEKVNIELIPVGWDFLIEGLQKHSFDAAFSSLPPLLIYQDLYQFSDLYLANGPCIVLRTGEKIRSVKDLSGKEVAVQRGDMQAMQVLQTIPNILIRMYDAIPMALNDTVNQTIDGVCFSALGAWSYCHDLYQDTLHVAMGPLNQTGLRLVAIKGEHKALINTFNETLEKLKKSGKYHELMKKWSLGPEED